MDDRPNCAVDVAMSSKFPSTLRLSLEKIWGLDLVFCMPKAPRPLSIAPHLSKALVIPCSLYEMITGPGNQLVSERRIAQLVHGNETLTHDNLAVEDFLNDRA